MNSKFLIIPVFLFGVLFVGQISDSYGHGLGSETMPPVMIGDTEATLEVNSSTIYTDIDGEEKGIRQISIDFFETFTNIESNEVRSIDNVTFQVDLIKSGNSIISETFQRDDGVLIMNLTPSDNEQVQVMERETFASFFGLASEQYNFEGEIFENGGLYEFEISVLTINSYDNVLTDPVNYELGISIEETTRYEINDVNFGKQEIGIVTFFDQITEFDYNVQTKEITFSFPFEWDQNTIDQTTVIHEEVLVPKTYGDLLVAKYVATLNGLELPESMINIDDFSADDRLVHIVVSQKELQEIFLKEREYSIKWVEWNDVFDPKKMPPIRNIWLKPNGKIPGDSIFHHAFLSYVSDSGLLVPCMYPHGLSFMSPNLKMIASLDHAMWFQKRDFKWDDWILYSTDSPHTGGSRGLGRGTFFTRDGEIIASTIQEGLFRVKDS